ncbi:MAG: NTP transferase domain-containing protein [Candidatus Zixiibacteriota bacterium]|nr:MAG: NTP transferase domain-containing protein [candidate division Zixibacteria bacterium]
MKAVIMAGGFGTRLRPLTANLPKPMVPLVGRPVMEHIVILLKKHGITDILAILYFQSEQIRLYFGNGKKWGVKFDYVTAEADFGTAGSVKNAENFLDDRFIIISGDVVTDFDISQAIEFHEGKKADATMVLTPVEDPVSYGIVITSKSGKITRFLEKPSWGKVFSDTVNTGIYILEPGVLKMIPPKTEFDFSKNLFPLMLSKKRKLYGYVASGYWKDIGNIEEYFQAHQDVLEGIVSLGIPGKKTKLNGNTLYLGNNSMISHSANFSGNVVIGDNVRIGPRAKIYNSVVGSNSVIGRDVNINRIVGWDKISIGPQARISESILCHESYTGEAAIIDEECILSDGARVGDKAHIKRNVKIWPYKEVEAGATLSSSLIWGERWSRELFSDAKISGIGNAEITPEFASKVGAAYGALIGPGGSVAICRGASNASRMIYRAVISGMLSAGLNVADLQAAPIPVLRQVLKSGRFSGGINVRMSPRGNNEMEIIFFDFNGRDLPISKTKSIERLFFGEDFRRAPIEEAGSIEYPQRVYESYWESFLSHIDKNIFENSSIKVVIDYGFAGASEILPRILGSLGIDSVALNSFVDPRQPFYFVQRQAKAIDQLSSIVKSLKADIGILLNSAAEKIRVVDEKGEAVSDQKLLLKVTRLYCDAFRPKKVAFPITSSAAVQQIASDYKAKLIWIPGDHQAMMDAASSNRNIFVGGTKGGFIFPGFQLGVDAMFAVIKILELMIKNKTDIGKVKGPWDQLFMSGKEVACSWSLKGQVMRRLMEFSENKKRLLIDGVRIVEDDYWILVRPDRKKALFHILAESESLEKSKELVKEFSSLIKKWQK